MALSNPHPPHEVFEDRLLAILASIKQDSSTLPRPTANSGLEDGDSTLLGFTDKERKLESEVLALVRELSISKQELKTIRETTTPSTFQVKDIKENEKEKDKEIFTPSISSSAGSSNSPSHSSYALISPDGFPSSAGSGSRSGSVTVPGPSPQPIAGDNLDRTVFSLPVPGKHCPTCGHCVLSPDETGSNKTILPDYIQRDSFGSSQTKTNNSDGDGQGASSGASMSAEKELELLKAQVQDIMRVCKAVATGDLTQKIIVPVEGPTMVELKDIINNMVDQLSIFATEVERVSLEVGTQGILGGQIVVHGIEGSWALLVKVVNRLAGNLTSQVRGINEVMSAVAKGDLSKTIEVEAAGEVAELKVTINNMVSFFCFALLYLFSLRSRLVRCLPWPIH